MPDNTRSVGNPMGNAGQDAAAAAGDLAQRARNAAASMTDTAGNAAAAALAESRSATAHGLDTAASAIHERADDLPGGVRVRNFARATADRLNTSADYVRSHDAKRMMADVETFVKSNPGPALVAAVAFGVLIGRALSRD